MDLFVLFKANEYYSRASYINNKELAAVGNMIERGENVEAVKHINVDHGIWIAMHGAGFGKLQWRYTYGISLSVPNSL